MRNGPGPGAAIPGGPVHEQSYLSIVSNAASDRPIKPPLYKCDIVRDPNEATRQALIAVLGAQRRGSHEEGEHVCGNAFSQHGCRGTGSSRARKLLQRQTAEPVFQAWPGTSPVQP
jgi:hypothetical protein